MRRLTFARWLYNHTNWRIAGGYPTIAASVKRPAGLEHAEPYVHALLDENRGWSPIFEDLWTHGWGIGIFAVVLSRKSLYYKDTATNAELADDVTRQPRIAARPVALRAYSATPGPATGADFDTVDLADKYYAGAGRTQPTVVLTADNGHLHGRFLKWLMSVRDPGLVNPVVFIDNEDSTGTIFSKDELAYYRALFEEMATRRLGEPALRPGIYAHGEAIPGDSDNSRSVAAQLIALYPEVYICQVGYGDRFKRKQLPTGPNGQLRAGSLKDNTFPVTNAAALHSIRSVPVRSLASPGWPGRS